MLHQLYSGLGAGVYPVLRLLRPFIEPIGGRVAHGWSQRLGIYPEHLLIPKPECRTLWLHAASVGEVQAALILVKTVLDSTDRVRIVVTSTTEQGQRLAASRMPKGVACLIAPLDVPQAVRRALRTLRPDGYVCLETELWPVMLVEAKRTGIPMLLLNGRLSQRSFERYRHIRGFMATLLEGFQEVAVISETDGQRYAALGVSKSRIAVCGNLKYDMEAASPDQARAASRRRLGVDSERVFLCGSTHDGEEAMLVEVFRALAARGPAVWVIAPRHLERLAEVEAVLRGAGLPFDRFSKLSGEKRTAEVVVVDTMGDLADLYAGGDYVFCGGSLVDRGGHNIVEAARWGRAVFFGPHMKDFQDAAEMLIAAGGGFRVADSAALSRLLLAHVDDPESYTVACDHAAAMAIRQRGAVARQAAMVRRMLGDE